MDTLDDNFNPPNPSNTETSPSLGRLLIYIGILAIIFALLLNFIVFRLIFSGNTGNNSAISIDFRMVYILVFLLLPFVMGVYLIVLGKHFNALSNNHSPERYSKLLSLKIQLLLSITIWLLMIAGVVFRYITV